MLLPMLQQMLLLLHVLFRLPADPASCAAAAAADYKQVSNVVPGRQLMRLVQDPRAVPRP